MVALFYGGEEVVFSLECLKSKENISLKGE